MENYDVVIDKTVKDLFKSSSLIQIKKYKLNKEKEIQDKDEEMQKMILDKYPVLIHSINSLEEINSNLNDLQEIRKKFKNGVDNLECLNNDMFCLLVEENEEEENEFEIDGKILIIRMNMTNAMSI